MGGALFSPLETVLCEVREGVAVLTVNRPASRNALSRQVMEDLSAALDRLGDIPFLAAIIVTGQGSKAFVAGADLSEMEKMTSEEAAGFSRYGQELFSRIESLPVPVIAAVNGFALGGGNELAVSCDLRIAARNARFGQPEVGVGVIPGFGGTVRLARLVGKGNALYMTMTGRVIDADEALRIGLVNMVVPEGEALTWSLALAREIGSKSPFAVRQAKKAVLEGLSLDRPSGFLVERRLFSECFSSPDQKEGMRAFLEKRTPAFRSDNSS